MVALPNNETAGKNNLSTYSVHITPNSMVQLFKLFDKQTMLQLLSEAARIIIRMNAFSHLHSNTRSRKRLHFNSVIYFTMVPWLHKFFVSQINNSKIYTLASILNNELIFIFSVLKASDHSMKLQIMFFQHLYKTKNADFIQNPFL